MKLFRFIFFFSIFSSFLFAGKLFAVCYVSVQNQSERFDDEPVKSQAMSLVQKYWGELVRELPERPLNADACTFHFTIFSGSYADPDADGVETVIRHKGIEKSAYIDSSNSLNTLELSMIRALYQHANSSKKFVICRDYGKKLIEGCQSSIGRLSEEKKKEIPAPASASSKSDSLELNYHIRLGLGRNFLFGDDSQTKENSDDFLGKNAILDQGTIQIFSGEIIFRKTFSVGFRFERFGGNRSKTGEITQRSGNLIEYSQNQTVKYDSYYFFLRRLLPLNKNSTFSIYLGGGLVLASSEHIFSEYEGAPKPKLNSYETEGSSVLFGATYEFGALSETALALGIDYRVMNLEPWKISEEGTSGTIPEKDKADLSGGNIFLALRIGF